MDEVKERFEIATDEQADWAFERLAQYRQQQINLSNEKSKYLEMYNKKISDWFEPQNNNLNNQISYFESIIENYRRTKPDQKVNVPSGKTSIRTSNVYIKDDDELTAYVEKEHPEFIKPTVVWGDFKKTLTLVNGQAVDENGEVVKGITTKQESKVFYKPNMKSIDLMPNESEDANNGN